MGKTFKDQRKYDRRQRGEREDLKPPKGRPKIRDADVWDDEEEYEDISELYDLDKIDWED